MAQREVSDSFRQLLVADLLDLRGPVGFVADQNLGVAFGLRERCRDVVR